MRFLLKSIQGKLTAVSLALVAGVVLLSGDRHLAEISLLRADDPAGDHVHPLGALCSPPAPSSRGTASTP